MTPVRIGLIGAGDRARRRHIPQLAAHGRAVDVVGIVDPDPVQGALSAAAFAEAGVAGVEPVSSVHELLDRGPDAVVVSSPNDCHVVQAMAAIEAGADVYLEKPLTTTADEAMALRVAAAAFGRTVVGALQGGLSPTRQLCRRFVGDAGAVTFIGAVVEDWEEPHADTWRLDPARSGGGVLFDSGMHMLHLVAELFGAPSEVHARFTHRPNGADVAASVLLSYPSGTHGTIHATGRTKNGPPVADLQVFRPDGTLRTSAWGRTAEAVVGDREPVVVDEAGWDGGLGEFLRIRRGEAPNVCGLDEWLTTIELWERIRDAASSTAPLVGGRA